MAMRRYTKREFEAELKKLGLVSTDHVQGSVRFWRTQKGGHISVSILPPRERYPDHMLDEVIRQIARIDAEQRP